MTQEPQQTTIVYFGMMGVASVPPLEALLAAGFAVRAIVVLQLDGSTAATAPVVTTMPQSPVQVKRKRPQLLNPIGRNLRKIAQEQVLPLFEVGNLRDPAVLATIAAYQPDAICVACFSRRFPAELLRIPRLGCLNVHPSLLPANRGPDPLFWTFRHGDTVTGVTVHLMDEGFDSGPILVQEQVEVPVGCSEYQLELRLATLGGELLVQALNGLAMGSIVPQTQESACATYYGFPTADDYVITPNHTAGWAYHFAAGLYRRPQPIVIAVGEERFRLILPLNYDEEAMMDAPWHLNGEVLALRCSPGVLRARVERPHPLPPLP